MDQTSLQHALIGTKTGFSIVTWNTESLSGTKSLDTGLVEKPDFVITKVLDPTDDWLTFHKGISSTESFILNGNRVNYQMQYKTLTHSMMMEQLVGYLVVQTGGFLAGTYSLLLLV